MADNNAVRSLYKRLLALYPHDFKERLGESMEQTFTDLYNERKSRKGGVPGFVLSTFMETSVGIVGEHILLLKEFNPMINIRSDLRPSILISSFIMVPFLVLDFATRTDNARSQVSIEWFAFAWLQLAISVLALMPIVHNLRAGNSIIANPVSLSLRVLLSGILVWTWAEFMLDQMPCFLGATGC